MATTRIKSGSKSVYVNGRPAARVGDATVKGGLGSISSLATTITDATSGIKSKIDKIKSTISGATSFITDLKAQVGDEIGALTAPISEAISSVTSVATDVVNQIKEVAGSLATLPEDVLGELTSGLLDSTSVFGALKTEIGSAISDVSSIPADLLMTIASVKSDIAAFTSFITDFPAEIAGQFTSELDTLETIFDGVIPDLGSLVDIGSVLTETAQGVVPSLVDIAPVLTFNSLNDLRIYFDTTKNPSDRTAVNIISYHPGYGLGGGTFIYEADNQSPETNGNVVVDAAGRRWVRVTNNEAIKAVDFGVLPNTGKDATSSLNEASLAAQTKRSAIDNSQVCEVLLPSGEILVENQLLMRDGIVFRGDSSNGTVIVVSWEFNTTAIKIINENANSAIPADQRAANIGFKNVRFKTKGSPPVGTGVINLSYANAARFSNLRFTLLNGAVAFAVNDLQSPVLDSIDVAGGDLLKVNTPIGSTFGVNNGAISKATVVGGRLLLEGISSLNQLTDIKIDGQNALTTTFSIGADAFRNKVSGLVTKGATTTGLLIAGDQNTVADVVLEHPGVPASIVSGNENNVYGVFTGTIVSNVSGDDNTFEGTFNVTDDPPWIDTGLRNSFNNSILQGQIDELEAGASDGILTPSDKVAIVPLLKDLLNTAAGLDTRANALGITTERTAFSTAISTLTTYLGTLTTPVLWDNQSGNTTIPVPATFITNYRTALETRQNLITKIDELNANATVPASSANSVWFSQFEQELTGWAVYDGYALTKTNVFLTGNLKKCFRLNITFTANNQFIAVGQDINSGIAASRIADVVPSSRMFISVGVEVGTTSGGTLSNAALQIQWFKADGTSSSMPFTDVTTVSGNQSFNTKLKGFVTVPADAVRAAIFVYLANLTSGAGQKWLLITEPMLTQAHALQTFEPAFVPGPTADTRLLGLGNNLMYNSRLSPDLSGYGAAWNGTVGGTPQRGLNASGKHGARNVAWVQCSNTPANDTIVEGEASVGPTGALSELRRYAIEVTPGDRLYVSMMFGFVGFKNAYLVVTYGDSTGVYVTEVGTGGAPLTSPGNGDLGTAMTRQGGFVTVPANAKWAWLRPRFTANGSGVTPIGYWSDPYVAKVPAVQTTPPPFSHGEIARGSIVDQIPPTAQIDNGRVIGSDANRVQFSRFENLLAWGPIEAASGGIVVTNAVQITTSGRKGLRVSITATGAGSLRYGLVAPFLARIQVGEKIAAQLVTANPTGVCVVGAVGMRPYDSTPTAGTTSAMSAITGGFTGQRWGFLGAPGASNMQVSVFVRIDTAGAGSGTFDIYEPAVSGATTDQNVIPQYNPGLNSTDGADVTRQNPSGGLIAGATQLQTDGTQRKLPYGVLEKWLEDGDSWTFPTEYASPPKAKSIQGGIRVSTGLSGEQVQSDSFVVTTTGLTASLKNKEKVGSPASQSQTTWTNVSSVRRECDKPTSADAFDNHYTVEFDALIYVDFDWFDNEIYPGKSWYSGEITVAVYTDDGGGFASRGSTVVPASYSNPGYSTNPPVASIAASGSITFTAPAIGQHGGREIRIEITARSNASSVFNGSNDFTYLTATAPASASRTTASEKVLVRVEAGQEL